MLFNSSIMEDIMDNKKEEAILEIKQEITPETKTEITPEIKTEIKTEVKPEITQEVKLKAKSEKIKKVKKVRTEREKKRRQKKTLIILASIAVVIGVFFIVVAIVNSTGYNALLKRVETYDKVVYSEAVLVPELDTDGFYSFTTDRDFKVIQLTDIHLGAGAFSINKDKMAINAVAAMITAEKPDLVIFTGDVVYPVPIQAGTSDNLKGATLIANLMEELEVYWTITFGNHDTESYSKYNRAEISAFYEGNDYSYCLFQRGPEDVDGYGNSVIKIKRTNGLISQALITVDSHAYLPGNNLGISWEYDNIHENQVVWYEQRILALNAENAQTIVALDLLGTPVTNKEDFETVKSLMFFHIPLTEMLDAYTELKENNYADTVDTKYFYGSIHESGQQVYCGAGQDTMFEKMLELGSTKGMFFGHDHDNNLSIDYKGIRMTYGKSVDYLAYQGISKRGSQRGCTVINVDGNGNSNWSCQNYYQEKYVSKYPKERVKMQWDTDNIVVPEE